MPAHYHHSSPPRTREGKLRQVPELPGNPLVSILIPCFNEAGSGKPPSVFLLLHKKMDL